MQMSTTRRCSSWLSVGLSPVVPQGTRPCDPDAICQSIRARNACSSIAPSLKGVTSAGIEPWNFARSLIALRPSIVRPAARRRAGRMRTHRPAGARAKGESGAFGRVNSSSAKSLHPRRERIERMRIWPAAVFVAVSVAAIVAAAPLQRASSEAVRDGRAPRSRAGPSAASATIRRRSSRDARPTGSTAIDPAATGSLGTGRSAAARRAPEAAWTPASAVGRGARRAGGTSRRRPGRRTWRRSSAAASPRASPSAPDAARSTALGRRRRRRRPSPAAAVAYRKGDVAGLAALAKAETDPDRRLALEWAALRADPHPTFAALAAFAAAHPDWPGDGYLALPRGGRASRPPGRARRGRGLLRRASRRTRARAGSRSPARSAPPARRTRRSGSSARCGATAISTPGPRARSCASSGRS